MKETTKMNIMRTIGNETVVWVKVEPNDGRRRFLVTADIAQTIIDAMPDKYRVKLIGLRKDLSGFVPVFDEETQREWDEELNAYVSRKAAWCEKYGSE
jgi:hypothetical protein